MPQILQYTISPELVAFSTSRHGGYGTGNYAQFNANEYCQDNPQTVVRNRELLCAQLGIEVDKLILPHQVHNTEVRNIDNNFLNQSIQRQKELLEGCDALMTSVQGICIGVSTADCIPVIIYDPKAKVLSVVHAGWRGTVKRIAEVAVEKMRSTYSITPKDCVAVIGPGISLDSFEVGDEVYEAFEAQHFPMDKISRKYAKWHIDLWEANRLSLINAGLSPCNIQISGICTYKSSEHYFSARKLGINSGRILTGAMIKHK